jgi:hypothetical protein
MTVRRIITPKALNNLAQGNTLGLDAINDSLP